MNIGRFLALYETYKRTLNLAGHIAEVGVWKASSLLYFAKLTRLFESESPTLVHGFDWYRGMVPGSDEMTDHVQNLLKKKAADPQRRFGPKRRKRPKKCIKGLKSLFLCRIWMMSCTHAFLASDRG